MGKTRQKANLTSDNLITSNIDTDRIGINSTSPTATLDVGGNVKVSGVITSTSFVKSGATSSQFLKGDGSVDSSTYISSVGIQSAGLSIGNATTLNFVGSGNTFLVNGSTIDISISGGGGGGESYWASTTVGIHTLSNIGIGTTNPTSKLSVDGDGNFTGVVTATSFSGSGTNLTGIVTSIVAGSNVTISGSTGQVTINASGGGGGGGINAVVAGMIF